MFIVKSKVIITQKTQIKGKPERNKAFKFDFVSEFSCSDSWRDFTNEGRLVLPKNIIAIDDTTGKKVPLGGSNLAIGGTESPLFLRGDAVTVDYYYVYQQNGKEVTDGTETPTSHLFSGYISEVTSKKPIELKLEDNFWKLKQLPCPTKTYKSGTKLNDILIDLLKPYNDTVSESEKFNVKMVSDTTFGEFRVGNETVAECLGRIRKTYRFEFYFRENTLYSGVIVYDEAIAKRNVFKFQYNIISDELQYNRKDDIVLSIIASNSIEESTGKQNKDGSAKTKRTRIEVLLTLRNGSNEPEIFRKPKGGDYPPNTGGERAKFQYPGANNEAELIKLATDDLRRYYYTGFKGKFTTFGIPYTKTGDNVVIIDPVLPERNGTYKCKSVDYEVGMNGIRQTIELDYLIQL